MTSKPGRLPFGAWLYLLLCAATAWGAGRTDGEWPMLAHDAARSGATTAEIRPPFERKWYRLFGDEGLMSGVQPVVAGGKVFVGTLAGTLHAIDDRTGKDAWTFQAGGAILHTCAADGGKVFFGAADGKVYAVGAADGKPAWAVQTGAAVWNAPAVHAALVLIASRDGKLYAIEAADGKVRWSAATSGPILSSPAVDAKASRAYVGSEDMHVYAFSLADGKLAWRSDKLPGASLRGYHPVVAPDGSVLVTAAPGISLDAIEPILHDMVKEVFGDFENWRHTKEENARLRRENFQRMEDPRTYPAQLAYIRKRLAEQPACQTFFVLDPATGKQPRRAGVAPIVYAESMNGPGAPPLVTPDGKVIVKYQALLRSRYGHYSPFLNVGYLDTATGHVTPIMDQSRTYGWHDSLLLVHDEQCQLTLAGRVLINVHQDNVNAMDLDTLKGYGQPLCHSIHEPAAGEAVGIWALLLRGRELPAGKEWLHRGTAVYGGGSVIDVGVSVAGDSFYYVPTHEINCGAAVIAYRMRQGGRAGERSKPPAEKLTPQEWAKVQQLPWDWDTLSMPRLNKLLKDLPGKVPGTRQEPLTDQAAAAVAKITDDDIDRFIWEASSLEFPASIGEDALRGDLAREVRELISSQWRPLLLPAGKHPTESYRVFVEPTETLYTLARAYPYLDADLQRQVRQHVAKLSAAQGGIPMRIGTSSQPWTWHLRRTYDPNDGQVRSLYDPPPAKLVRATDDIVRCETARLYPIWLWARATGDWDDVERNWNALAKLLDHPPNKMEEDCRNGYVAGLIAYCRLAAHVKDAAAVERGLAAARKAVRERLAYELAYPRGGLISQVPQGRSIFARWRHLTPEAGRLLAAHAAKTHRDLMSVVVDYHRPTWWLAWNVELMWRNESPMSLPTMSAEVFAARAMILSETGRKLRRFLDIPWCKADLFYLQKLVCCIEADAKHAWRDVRQQAPRPGATSAAAQRPFHKGAQ